MLPKKNEVISVDPVYLSIEDEKLLNDATEMRRSSQDVALREGRASLKYLLDEAKAMQCSENRYIISFLASMCVSKEYFEPRDLRVVDQFKINHLINVFRAFTIGGRDMWGIYDDSVEEIYDLLKLYEI